MWQLLHFGDAPLTTKTQRGEIGKQNNIPRTLVEVVNYRIKHTHLEDSLAGSSHSSNKIIVVDLLLEPITSPTSKGLSWPAIPDRLPPLWCVS